MELQNIYSFIEGRLNWQEQKSFWIAVTADHKKRSQFYSTLVSLWHQNKLSPYLKEIAIKLYKETPEFKTYFNNYNLVADKRSA